MAEKLKLKLDCKSITGDRVFPHREQNLIDPNLDPLGKTHHSEPSPSFQSSTNITPQTTIEPRGPLTFTPVILQESLQYTTDAILHRVMPTDLSPIVEPRDTLVDLDMQGNETVQQLKFTF